MNLKEEIRKGIPSTIPSMPNFLPGVSRAPKRKKILNTSEKKLAVRNALRYFPSSFHSQSLITNFFLILFELFFH